MLFLHPIDLPHHIVHLAARPLNGGTPIALALPPLNVAEHLIVPALLLLGVVTELTHVGLGTGLVDQLQAARLAHPVFLVALLPEMAPAPVAARPAGLFEVAHGWVSTAATMAERRSPGRDKQDRGRSSGTARQWAGGEIIQKGLAWVSFLGPSRPVSRWIRFDSFGSVSYTHAHAHDTTTAENWGGDARQ